jgi:hypothetical protein
MGTGAPHPYPTCPKHGLSYCVPCVGNQLIKARQRLDRETWRARGDEEVGRVGRRSPESCTVNITDDIIA